jgi:LPXTG-motif cell wall-anchored protein
VDYDAQEIYLAEVTQNNVTPSPARFDSASTACESPKLSQGTIAAIVLGSIVGVALIGGSGYWFLRRRRMRNLINLENQHRPTIVEREPSLYLPFQQYELPVERRTSELPSPDGVLPPPSPHAPYSHPPVLAMPVLPRGRAPSQASTRSDSPNSFLSTHTTRTGINQASDH